MFQINEDLSIYATRGDIVFFKVTAKEGENSHLFNAMDVVRITVYGKKNVTEILMQKDIILAEETDTVEVLLTKEDTTFGDPISKPKDYWYEIELNPTTNPQTIIGYDESGPKVFRLYPESVMFE